MYIDTPTIWRNVCSLWAGGGAGTDATKQNGAKKKTHRFNLWKEDTESKQGFLRQMSRDEEFNTISASEIILFVTKYSL